MTTYKKIFTRFGAVTLTVGCLALLPAALNTNQVAAAGGSISINGSILDADQPWDTTNYKYSPGNPKKVQPGEWFKIQFRVKNNGQAQLKNVKLDWSPTRLNFNPSGAGPNGETVTANSYKLSFTPFNKGGERTYAVLAKFVSGVEDGKGIDNLPEITATNSSNGNKVSNSVTALGVVVQRPVAQPEDPDPDCPDGQELNENNECVTLGPDCPEGQELDENGACITPDPDCPEGQELNENGECVASDTGSDPTGGDSDTDGEWSPAYGYAIPDYSDGSSDSGETPLKIASTGPGAVAASIIGVSAIGYGARQWIASRRAMHEAMEGLYKAKK